MFWEVMVRDYIAAISTHWQAVVVKIGFLAAV
jgi:hypothetical protein